MAIKSQSEIINQTDTVQLKTTFYNILGEQADPGSFPLLRVIQPSGNVILGPTSAGVYRLDTGVYGFDYTLGVNSSLGVWTHFWSASIDGQIQIKELNFIVHNTQMPLINSDGYESLGDDIGFNYNQTEIRNINKILKAVKARLKSSGKALKYDQFGNQVYADCDIYSTEMLVTFIDTALTEINSVPHFTEFTFNDTQVINLIFSLLVQGAVIFALASQALIERGREWNLQDNGLSLTPPTMSEALQTQYNTELSNWTEKVKFVKANMKPGPTGMGVMTLTNGGGSFPILRAMSMMRARRIF